MNQHNSFQVDQQLSQQPLRQQNDEDGSDEEDEGDEGDDDEFAYDAQPSSINLSSNYQQKPGRTQPDRTQPGSLNIKQARPSGPLGNLNIPSVRHPARLDSSIQQNMNDEGESDDEESDDEGDEEDDKKQKNDVPCYNPKDYENLEVSEEIEELFNFITDHKPSKINIETTLVPFIPDYIPAVGQIDAFLKIPRADKKATKLGLNELDEPASQQSDPAFLEMKIRCFSTEAHLTPITVRSIENASQQPHKIGAWIQNIENIHRNKPFPTVDYSNRMPEIEKLMQVWPRDFEQLLKTTQLPPADLDVDLEQYAHIVCAIFDIPVYPNNLVESLHHLFSLYSEFKIHEHFSSIS